MEAIILKYGARVALVLAVLFLAHVIGHKSADWRWRELERTASEKRLQAENDELRMKLQSRLIIDSAR